MFDSHILDERLDILLALALAFSEKDNLVNENLNDVSSESKSESICNESKDILNSLPVDDFNRIINKLNFYQSWNLQEQNAWKFRILQRMQDRSFWLDKFIHHTHLSKVLQTEPLYIQLFILQHLPADISHPIAVSLGILQQLQETNLPQKAKKNNKSNSFPNEELKTIVREKFLSNFIAFEDIYSPKPLDYLSGDEALNVIYQLGVNEIAFACCGIKEIENLATFLRRFSEYTSQLIVNKLAKFNKIESERVFIAESMVQEWWEKANNNTSALVGLIGFHKLARAMIMANSQELTYFKQKLTVDLAKQFDDEFLSVKNLLQYDAESEQNLIEIAKTELDEIAYQIFIESKGVDNSFDLNIEEPVYTE